MPSILDSHIHLWPQSASDENGHSWMTPGMPLAKQHILPDYRASAQQNSGGPQLKGVVYVETDRRYDTTTADLATWAQGPLEEVRFVRSVVEGHYGAEDSSMLRGIVLWAPMDQTPDTLREWLRLAEEVAGSETWKRVKGFRFLLQAIHDQQKFQSLVLSKDFCANLKILGQRGFSFDVGVDQRLGGAWQLEAMFVAIQQAHEGLGENEKVTFILNHLCKPDFALSTTPSHENIDYYRWCQSIEKMAHCAKTYMKLSGAFSELPKQPKADDDVASQILPWVEHIFKCFGPRRVMFGSDWPVCNVNGPTDGNPWALWTHTVGSLLEHLVERSQQDYVWSKTAEEAYRLA